MSKNIAILGASDKTDRYSNKALKLLKEHGYNVLPIHPKLSEIDGIKVYKDLANLENIDIDTLTIYVSPEISKELEAEILKLKPKRVIFNPDTENKELKNKLEATGVKVMEACTLVMLSTGQF